MRQVRGRSIFFCYWPGTRRRAALGGAGEKKIDFLPVCRIIHSPVMSVTVMLPTEQMIIDTLADVYPAGMTSKQIAAKLNCTPADINRRRGDFRGVYSIPGITQLPDNNYCHVLAAEPEGDGLYQPITVPKIRPIPKSRPTHLGPQIQKPQMCDASTQTDVPIKVVPVKVKN